MFEAGPGAPGGPNLVRDEVKHGGGGGGGGTGGIIASSAVINIPTIPTAADGTQGTRANPGGSGGTGWGAGGGGGSGAGDQSNSVPGNGGSGAPGINIVIVGTGYTTLQLPDSKDLNKFQAGDLVQNGWNQSQTWSNFAVGTPASGTALTNATDGDLSTMVRANDNNDINWTFPQEVSGEVELYANVGSALSSARLVVNGLEKTSEVTASYDNATWVKISGVTGLPTPALSMSAQDCGYLGYSCWR